MKAPQGPGFALSKAVDRRHLAPRVFNSVRDLPVVISDGGGRAIIDLT